MLVQYLELYLNYSTQKDACQEFLIIFLKLLFKMFELFFLLWYNFEKITIGENQ
nr:MAG TPA: hypothetical protein [Caudoviricetes sp.]